MDFPYLIGTAMEWLNSWTIARLVSGLIERRSQHLLSSAELSGDRS